MSSWRKVYIDAVRKHHTTRRDYTHPERTEGLTCHFCAGIIEKDAVLRFFLRNRVPSQGRGSSDG
jgi:hypothetical protein